MTEQEMREWIRIRYPSIKEAYENGGSQYCYQTPDGTVCEPLDLWTLVLYLLLTSAEKSVEREQERKELLTRSRSRFFQDDNLRVLNRAGVLKLVEYFALCYSKLNDSRIERDWQAAKRKGTPTYWSYGWKVNRILTSDQYLSCKAGKKNKINRNAWNLTLEDYQDAYRRALEDRRNGCSYIKGLSPSGEEELFRLVSLVPVYDRGEDDNGKDNSGVCSTKEKKYKCNIYVGDVMFGVLTLLLYMAKPEDDPAEKLHDLLIDLKLYSDHGRMDFVSKLSKTLPALLDKTWKPKYTHNSKQTGKGQEWEVFPDAAPAAMQPFEYLALQCQRNNGCCDFHHIVIRVDGSREDAKKFYHISAHEFATTILADKTETTVTAESFQKNENAFGGNFYLELVNLFDVIQKVFTAYCDRYFPS